MTSNLRNRKAIEKSVPGISSQNERLLQPADDDKTSDPSEHAYKVIPLIERWTLTRLDVGPFIVLYAILFAADVTVMFEEKWLVTLALGSILLLHLTVALLCQWSFWVKATVGYHMGTMKEAEMKRWTHALVEPQQDTVKGGLAPIKMENGVARITFHDTVLRCSVVEDLDVTMWNSSKVSPVSDPTLCFRTLRYPVDWKRSRYAAWSGHSLETATTAGRVYGFNITKLALPTFGELLMHQLIAPFFLFQVFCVVLWSLDEYWYYAIFTFFALLFFESTVAYNRLQSLQKLHHAGHDGVQRVWVCRGGISSSARQWMLIPTKEVVPGDMISLSVAVDGTPTHIPADIVLLEGSAVCDEALLTGESVPQLKQPLDTTLETLLDVQDSSCQESILFGGTNLITGSSPEDCVNPPPDKGTIGIVLRTGFGTSQGNLLRTMAHSTHTADSVHTWDTFYFIAALIVCALVAAGWVLADGWNDPRRNRFRLILHVIIIVTSVVPPELPMELSLALTNSVAALVHRCQVYCAELNRIPWAGQVEVCCFDKTGTLTSDEMCLRGVRLFQEESENSELEEKCLLQPSTDEIPWEVTRIMAGCQALAMAGMRKRGHKPRMIGDPLEQAVLKETKFSLYANNMVVNDNGKSLTILHRFAFTSKLKRMTTLVAEGSNPKVWALTKGAPEVVKPLLKAETIPKNFDKVSFHHMSHGRRVLAMAYRETGTADKISLVKGMGREGVEKNLVFAGFLVLDCPLKLDSAAIIRELNETGHRTIMITGDSLLTAAEVARQVGIIPAEIDEATIYEIKEKEDGEGSQSDVFANFECTPLRAGSASSLELSMDRLAALKRRVDQAKLVLCVSGGVINKLAVAVQLSGLSSSMLDLPTSDEKHLLLHSSAQAVLMELVPLISVFARHSPHQKEAIVAAFNQSGAYTLFAGDGVNDVGALKRAHVGISILSAPEAESKQRKATKKIAKLKKKVKKDPRSSKNAWEESLKQLQEAQEEISGVELGDASVAAPFTSRAVSIKCCKDVIQQGRCTLVTMLQIYKILGINCVSGYSRMPGLCGS